MYRNLTLYTGIILIFISILILIGIVPSSIILMFSASFAACIFSITDLFEEIKPNKKARLMVVLDFIAISSVIIALVIPNKEKYDSLLQGPSNFVTFLGFSLVILTIGVKNSKFIMRKLREAEDKIKQKVAPRTNMDDEQIHQVTTQLAISEYNSVLEYNDIIVELKKCDYAVSKFGRVHDGWALFHDILAGTYNRYNEPFYDMLLNDLFKDFLVELGQAVSIFASTANPDSNKKIKTIKMWTIDMEILSFNTLYKAIDINKGMQMLSSSLEKWDNLKEKATYKYEMYRERVS